MSMYGKTNTALWRNYSLLLLLLSHFSRVWLCDPIDGSPPGSPVPGILQARTLEWVAISFSNAGKWKVKGKSLSRVRLFVTPWTAAYQAPPPMGFSALQIIQSFVTFFILPLTSIYFNHPFVFTDILHNNSQLLLNVILVAYTWWLYNLTCTALGVGSMLYLFCRLGS